jgi:hypothetical protein
MATMSGDDRRPDIDAALPAVLMLASIAHAPRRLPLYVSFAVLRVCTIAAV